MVYPVGEVKIVIYNEKPAEVTFSNLQGGFSFKHAKMADKAFKKALRQRRREYLREDRAKQQREAKKVESEKARDLERKAKEAVKEEQL